MNKLDLQKGLSINLPGENSHLKMSPLGRIASSEAKLKAVNIRDSAVAVIFFQNVYDLEIILIQRPEYQGNHSGQVSFPGGKKESTDISLKHTAIRECFEEIGVELSEDDYVGELTPVFIPVSSFHVDVHVFFLNNEPKLIKDDWEVDSIFTIKIGELLNQENLKHTNIVISDNYTLKNVPYFHLENKIIWGATALVLSEIKDLINSLKI